MAVKIRMARAGGKNKPFFRVVVTDGRRPNTGRYIEVVGWYDPLKARNNYEIKLDRIEAWLGKGAVASPLVAELVRKTHRKMAKAVVPAAPAPAAQ